MAIVLDVDKRLIGVNNERGEEMTQEKLKEILDKHNKWLNGEYGGERADLRGTDLRHIDLRDTDLLGADIRGANLRGTNLRGADLRGADLRDTDLRDTGISYANLRGAKLSGADLTNAVYMDTLLNLQCPEEGSFIAWKKLARGDIAKLLIPEDAKRSSGTSRKCRASKAIVLKIYWGGKEISEGRSRHDVGFIYRVGETVYPDSWDEDRWNECSHGIHFFITRKEAEEY